MLMGAGLGRSLRRTRRGRERLFALRLEVSRAFLRNRRLAARAGPWRGRCLLGWFGECDGAES